MQEGPRRRIVCLPRICNSVGSEACCESSGRLVVEMAEVGEAVEGRSLADLCVARQTSGEIHPDTHRCRLNFLSPEGADVSVAFVPIVHVEGKLLVAVPFVAWHRTASRRLLPKGALSKPVPVEVSGTLVEEAAEEESIDITTKAWVGFLSAELLQAAVIGEPEEGAITAEFGEERAKLEKLVTELYNNKKIGNHTLI